MARRDTAAAAAQSFPATNPQHRRGRWRLDDIGPPQHGRRRRPGESDAGIGGLVREVDSTDLRAAQLAAAEALFGGRRAPCADEF